MPVSKESLILDEGEEMYIHQMALIFLANVLSFWVIERCTIWWNS